MAHSIQRDVEVARRVMASPLSCERDEVEGWVGVQKTLLLRRQNGTRGLLLLSSRTTLFQNITMLCVRSAGKDWNHVRTFTKEERPHVLYYELDL
jgi:hypothetical protein